MSLKCKALESEQSQSVMKKKQGSENRRNVHIFPPTLPQSNSSLVYELSPEDSLTKQIVALEMLNIHPLGEG